MESGVRLGAGADTVVAKRDRRARESERCCAVRRRNNCGLIWCVDRKLDGGELRGQAED